jgi:hypothetical protein
MTIALHGLLRFPRGARPIAIEQVLNVLKGGERGGGAQGGEEDQGMCVEGKDGGIGGGGQREGG